MVRGERAWLMAALLLFGMGWGLTVVLGKVAVSDGYRPLGIIFWQFALGGAVLAVLNGRRGLPRDARALRFYAVIALIGTLLPNSASYTAAVHLPAGILSIVIATAPMLAFPMALALGVDRFSAARLAGLLLGLVAIAMIALPEASLPDPAMAGWLPIALIAPLLYAAEANYVGTRQPAQLGAVQVLYGASIIGAVVTLPLALLTGSWISPLPPFALPDWAVVMSAILHALVYAGYVWLVGRAGAVFAAQVAYLVTAFGVFWSGLLLNETYSIWVWGAFAVMLAGLFLVQPRRKETLADLLPPGT